MRPEKLARRARRWTCLASLAACSGAGSSSHAAPDAGGAARDAGLTSDSGAEAEVGADSSNGSRTLAFVYNDPTSANPAGLNHVYVMEIDARGVSLGAHRLTSYVEEENSPWWSPDGQKLLMVRGVDGSGIYEIVADGTNAKRLSPTPARDVFPVYSPDGSRIAFTRLLTNPPALDAAPSKPTTELHVMNRDGSNDSVLLTSTLSVEPRWAVTNEIVFMSQMGGLATYEVFAIGADGAGLRQLTNVQANNGDPTWSPDGMRITFGSDREGGGKLDVFIMNADGSGQTALTSFGVPVEAGDTNWSTDGALVAFERDINGKGQSDPTAPAEVWTMHPDGSSLLSTHQPCSDVGCAPRFKP